MSYFDINDILASNQKVQCIFKKRVPKLGFFDPNSRSDDIEIGTKLDLPSWLAKELHKSQRSIVEIEVPKCYSATYRTILDADAHVVDLNKLGPFYYAFGIDLISYGLSEMKDLSKMLVETFTNRFRWIIDKGMNASGGDKPHLMDKAELNIYNGARSATKSYLRWISRQSEMILATDLAANTAKRSRSS